jgi:hypothetical protein
MNTADSMAVSPPGEQHELQIADPALEGVGEHSLPVRQGHRPGSLAHQRHSPIGLQNQPIVDDLDDVIRAADPLRFPVLLDHVHPSEIVVVAVEATVCLLCATSCASDRGSGLQERRA